MEHGDNALPYMNKPFLLKLLAVSLVDMPRSLHQIYSRSIHEEREVHGEKERETPDREKRESDWLGFEKWEAKLDLLTP